MIRYVVDVGATHRHSFSVELRIERPDSAQRLSLPAWIPGSYLVREFARHLSGLTAEQGGTALPLEQLDKATWLARGCRRRSARRSLPGATPSTPRFARRSSMSRAASSTAPASACASRGRKASRTHSRCAACPTAGTSRRRSSRALAGGAHEFVAADYDTLVDHPVELGRFWRGRFDAAGVPHEFVVAGALPDFDGERLLADTKRLCEAEIAFWHGSGPAPFERYLFMLNALEDGRGGLEHRSSTALVAPRRDLPRRVPAEPAKATPTKAETSDGYVGVLGLIAHEYFHAWNVKRLKPREFATFDYAGENYTRLLWFFEGFTSYYDDLFVLRAGLIDAPRYLKLLATTISSVQASPGGSCRASPMPASMPGSSTTAPTRTRRTRPSATTPRARSSRSPST
jgi:predicted metalloprotease with PDZ domain